MNPKDNDIEGYLKRFQPRAVRPLELPVVDRARRWRLPFAVAAAALLIAAVLLLSRGRHSRASRQSESEMQPPITVMQFKVASRTEQDLDAALRRSARGTLVSMAQPNTALNTLSKE